MASLYVNLQVWQSSIWNYIATRSKKIWIIWKQLKMRNQNFLRKVLWENDRNKQWRYSRTNKWMFLWRNRVSSLDATAGCDRKLLLYKLITPYTQYHQHRRGNKAIFMVDELNFSAYTDFFFSQVKHIHRGVYFSIYIYDMDKAEQLSYKP